MEPKTTRFNFELPTSVFSDLKRLADLAGRSGAADILRQLISEYVLWQTHGRSERYKPAWVIGEEAIPDSSVDRRRHPLWAIEKKVVEQAVKSSKTLSEAITKLGFDKVRGDHSPNIRRLKARLVEENIDFSHCALGAKKVDGESKFHSIVVEQELATARKAQIAESAVLFRLSVHGFHVFKPIDTSSKADWLVLVDGKHVKLQVKWVQRKGASRVIPLSCNKSRRYKPGDFDFIVGYDFYSDTTYVFSEAEVAHLKAVVAIHRSAAERWDKLADRSARRKPSWLKEQRKPRSKVRA